jgi:hypothetical protein
MLRFIAVLIATVALTGPTALADSFHAEVSPLSHAESVPIERLARSSKFFASLGITQSMSAPAAQSCCKICSRGKACGNTCIARDKVCHVGPGCACDG